MTELTSSWCLISRTMGMNAIVDHAGMPLWAAMNWSRSSLRTPAINYIVSRQRSTSIWSNLHRIACCCLLLLRPVLHTVFNCVSGVILSVTAIAASWCTNWCLRCCSVWAKGAFDQVLIVRFDSDWISAGWGVCGAMSCCCGNGEENDNKKWKVLRNIS